MSILHCFYYLPALLVVCLFVSATSQKKNRHYVTFQPAEPKLRKGGAERIDSPGEYKLASSWAPACCGPHLTAPRPGPCGSEFSVAPPRPSSWTILAISPLWARPLPFNLSDHSQEPTAASTSQPTYAVVISANCTPGSERISQSQRGQISPESQATNQKGSYRVHFLAPPVLSLFALLFQPRQKPLKKQTNEATDTQQPHKIKCSGKFFVLLMLYSSAETSFQIPFPNRHTLKPFLEEGFNLQLEIQVLNC